MVKTIKVTEETHEELTELGNTNDSYNDVIKELLRIKKLLEKRGDRDE